MSKLLDRYKRDAVMLECIGASREHQDLAQESMILNARHWKQIDECIRQGGDPTMVGGPFAGLELTPAIANATLVTIGATELLLWPGAGNTPIPANPQVPKLYILMASGTSTTAATPGTFTLAPRLGTLITSPLIGIATGAITPVASATAAQWRLYGWCYVRTGGATAIAQGSFEFNQSGTVGGGGPVTATGNAVFGGISASFDSTVASALVFGAIATTSTTNTFTPQFIGWGSWN